MKLNNGIDEFSKEAAPKTTPIIKTASPIKMPNDAHAPARQPLSEEILST
jgi:hypothetical protein